MSEWMSELSESDDSDMSECMSELSEYELANLLTDWPTEITRLAELAK